MLKRIVLIVFVSLVVLTGLLHSSSTAKFSPAVAASAFPDAHDKPPAGWNGPVFKLSQDYPTAMPTPEAYPWKNFDFKTQPMEYLKAVLAYGFEGNTDVDFEVQKNTIRKWYHAPWMHAGTNGREFIHGMTHERSSRPKELDPLQTSTWQNWAVGFYNAPGGYVIGRVWANPTSPDPALAQFPDGTMSIKLLFTQAPPSQVPYLANSVEWLADINRVTATGKPPQTLRLLQIDVAVRDKRANSTTGWVFGTYTYDANAPGATPWDRIVPIGLMYGNDPTKVLNGGTLKQTIINPNLHVAEHLGYKGRLNGPVDNPVSSCLSCHSTAQVSLDLSKPTRSGVPPANPSNSDLKLYFRNIKSGTPFDPGYTPLDYSLQLQVGIANLAKSGGMHLATPVHGRASSAVGRRIAGPRHGFYASRGSINVTPLERDGTPVGQGTRRRTRRQHR